ncbi:hypothetical protein ES708_09953 [subsurface metagenome]
MAYTYDELKKKKVTELRAIAAETEAVTGYSQMNKEHLLKELCTSLKIEMHEHHEVIAENKGEIKSRIKELKIQRDKALSAHNHGDLKKVRRQIHRLKRTLHKATV